jgi:hypothetical protein
MLSSPHTHFILAAAMFISGCESDHSASEPDAVDDSVKVAPIATASPYAAAAWPGDLDHVDVAAGDDGSILQAFNADDELIGELGVHYLGDSIRLTADFADGTLAAVIEIESDEVVDLEQTLDSAEVQHRAELIEDMINGLHGNEPQAFEGWSGCALHIAGVLAGCAPTGWWVPISCGLAGAAATCACLKAAKDGKAKEPCGKEKDKKK